MQIAVEIEGITPLLMNRFTEANEVAVSGGTSVSFRGDKGTPREQAAAKRYADSDGRLYIPGPNIFSALVAAGKFTKAGKSKLTTLKTSIIPAGLAVEEMVCSLVDSDGQPLTEWEVDSRSVVIPSTGGRIMAHRPRVDKWRCRFTINLDDAMFSPALARAVVDDAGRKIGIGDFRPERKGPFGKFAVTAWNVVEQDLRHAA